MKFLVVFVSVCLVDFAFADDDVDLDNDANDNTRKRMEALTLQLMSDDDGYLQRSLRDKNQGRKKVQPYRSFYSNSNEEPWKNSYMSMQAMPDHRLFYPMSSINSPYNSVSASHLLKKSFSPLGSRYPSTYSNSPTGFNVPRPFGLGLQYPTENEISDSGIRQNPGVMNPQNVHPRKIHKMTRQKNPGRDRDSMNNEREDDNYNRRDADEERNDVSSENINSLRSDNDRAYEELRQRNNLLRNNDNREDLLSDARENLRIDNDRSYAESRQRNNLLNNREDLLREVSERKKNDRDTSQLGRAIVDLFKKKAQDSIDGIQNNYESDAGTADPNVRDEAENVINKVAYEENERNLPNPLPLGSIHFFYKLPENEDIDNFMRKDDKLDKNVNPLPFAP